MRKITFILAAVIGTTSFTPTVRAQGVFNMGALTNTLSIDTVTQSEKKRASKSKYRGSSSRGTSQHSVQGSQASASRQLVAFAPSATLRKRHLNDFVAQMVRADPANAKQIKQVLIQQDVFLLTAKWMGKYGLKNNNLADTMAVYLTCAWLAARGSSADPTKAQILGVRKQMASALAQAPAIKNTSSAEKQQLADNLILQAALLSFYVEGAKNNPPLLTQIKTVAVSGARNSFGLDMNALKLTGNGLQM